MRWIVLALSLGAAIMSLIHGVFEIWISSGSAGFPAEAAGDAFTWVTIVLLGASAVFALVGGVLAFNRRRSGGIFLVISALICFFAHLYTRYYGGIYLVGGILTFFLHGPSEYDDEEDYDYEDEEYDDGDEDEDNDEEEEEENFPDERGREKERAFRAFSYGKRRARSMTFKENFKGNFKGNKGGYDPDDERFSKLNEPVRTRSSKVCPVCGASVGIDHKFCYTCGSPLHTASSPEKTETAAYESPSSPVIVSVGEDATRQEEQESPSLFKDFQTIFPSDSRPKSDEEDNESGELPPSPPHRVFVKPAVEDNGPVIKHPLLINPDDSYQEFSNYTRRRKRRRHSLLRRILAPLVLLVAIGSSAWFLLGLRKVPEPDLPVPPPIPLYEPSESDDQQAKPVLEESGGLPVLRIDAPARGVVVGSNVNVRPDHSISGTAITRLNADARVDLLDRWEGVSGNLSGPWFQVRTGGREGWIYGQYLQPLDARPSTLPEGYTASLLKTFGANKMELTNQLGQPTRQTATTLTWSGLTANFRGENEIVRLQATSARHVLLNGVTVGMTDEQLYKNVGYPSDYRSGQLRYIESGNQGMSVTMKNGKIQTVTVGNI
jgi:predicted nucleic acid-binding Zn ribbon protein